MRTGYSPRYDVSLPPMGAIQEMAYQHTTGWTLRTIAWDCDTQRVTAMIPLLHYYSNVNHREGEEV